MEDRCVCCGEIIPEGQWVCKNCMEGKENEVTEHEEKRADRTDSSV